MRPIAKEMSHITHINLFAADYGLTVEFVALNLRRTSREATVLLYSHALDSHLEKMTELADRLFCFYEVPKAPAKRRSKVEMKMPGSQATLGAYS
jgi:hypothetical protein